LDRVSKPTLWEPYVSATINHGARDYSSGAHCQKQGPNTESTFSQPLIPPPHFNHWLSERANFRQYFVL